MEVIAVAERVSTDLTAVPDFGIRGNWDGS
jgi:hypothetical protein